MSTPGKRAAIHIHEIERNSSLRNRKVLKKFIVRIFQAERISLDHLAIIFCSDQYLLKINRDYLHHDTYTDIITFDLSTGTDKVIGEIYISIERVRDNASSYHVPIALETARVLFHGVLHLCGYKDKTASEKEIMRSKEEYYLTEYDRFVSRETRST